MNSSQTHDVEVDLNTSTRYLSIHCPECLSAFSVDTSVITNPKPEFECLKCKSIFWFSLNATADLDSLIGFPKDINADSQPRAMKPDESRMALELEKLGTDPFIEDDSRANLLASDDVKDKWENAILNFEDQSKHDEFLEVCIADNNLEFAAIKYGLIKKALPTDEISLKMIKRIESLASVSAGVVEKSPILTKSNITEKKKGILRNIPWYYLISATSLALMLIGLSYPAFRNLVGVGVSIFFLTSAIKILLR